MNISTLTASEFLNKQEKDLCIVDLRTTEEVATECLGNCLHLPIQELTAEQLKTQLLANGFTVNTPVHLLCQSGKRANMAVEKLQDCSDFTLVILEGGLNAIKNQR